MTTTPLNSETPKVTPLAGVSTSTPTGPGMDTKIHAKWTEIKADIMKGWNKLSEGDLESTHGDQKAVNALLQKNYGETDTHSKRLTDIYERYDAKKVN